MSFPFHELGPISPVTLGRLHDSIKVLARIGQGTGEPHKSDVEELERRMAQHVAGKITFEEVITNTRLARAFLYGYPGELMAERAIAFNERVLDVLWSCLSRRPNALLATFFYCHSGLSAWLSLAERLRSHYDGMSIDECPTLERKTKNYTDILFSEDGPKRIAATAAQRGVSAADMELEACIPPEGKFHDAVVLWYYVCHVRTLPMGEVSPCLKEATEKKVSELPFGGQMLGHAVIEAMCMRCHDSGEPLPQPWLKRILNVAGDPRVGTGTLVFHQWWGTQRPEVVAVVKAALANRDLQYFLEALDEFASMQYGDIARMFHSRRLFLQGILKTGQVKDALLILSKDAADYIKKKLPAEERKHFRHSFLTDSNLDQSCVYLELPNGHIIEGTHQSQFRVYTEDSSFACWVRDKRPREVSYRRSVTQSDFIDAISHQRPVSWQLKVMDSMNAYLGLQVDPQLALDDQDYATFLVDYPYPY